MFVFVCLCGWWSPRPSGARLPAVAGARLKLGDQKDQWWRDVAASAAGAAGVKRDSALNNHQAGFSPWPGLSGSTTSPLPAEAGPPA